MKLYILLLTLTAALTAAPGASELNSEGLKLYYQAHYAEAESHYRQAREAAETPRDRGSIEINLGTVLRTEGRYAEGEPVLAEALHTLETAAGPDDAGTGLAASALAALYQAWGQPIKAEPLAARAERIFAAHLAPDSPERVNNSRVRASIYMDEKRYAAAEEILRDLVRGAETREAVGAYNDLAMCALAQRQLSKAESLAEQAQAIASRLLPVGHPVRADILNNLAQIYRFEGKYAEAEARYREAIDLWRKAFGPRNPDAAKGMLNLAALYHERGREAGAEDLYRGAAVIFQAAYGENHPLTLVARDELAEVLRAEGRFSESERLSRAVLPALEHALDRKDPRVVRALANYARLLEDTKRPREAAAVRVRIEGLL
ncbi:MAG TPA: tetratricopeptide repeat protein [Bryobacteraceae bacterium]|nr:tetratricopeptide repeat protein [Bryobacteraceae bacterium]